MALEIVSQSLVLFQCRSPTEEHSSAKLALGGLGMDVGNVLVQETLVLKGGFANYALEQVHGTIVLQERSWAVACYPTRWTR